MSDQMENPSAGTKPRKTPARSAEHWRAEYAKAMNKLAEAKESLQRLHLQDATLIEALNAGDYGDVDKGLDWSASFALEKSNELESFLEATDD